MEAWEVRHGGGKLLFSYSFFVVAALYILIGIGVSLVPYTSWNETISSRQIFFIGLITIFTVMLASYPLGRWMRWSRIKYLRGEIRRCERLMGAYSQQDAYSSEIRAVYERRKKAAEFFLKIMDEKKMITGKPLKV